MPASTLSSLSKRDGVLLLLLILRVRHRLIAYFKGKTFFRSCERDAPDFLYLIERGHPAALKEELGPLNKGDACRRNRS